MATMIIISWAFLVLHLLKPFPLSTWMGAATNKSVIPLILTLLLHFLIALAEHWTATFPAIAKFVIEFGQDPILGFSLVNHVAFLQFMLFFYFSYHNVKKVEDKKYVLVWMGAVLLLAFGPLRNSLAMSSVEDQIVADETSEAYNVGHFSLHCFLLVMLYQIDSHVSYDGGVKMGSPVEFIVKHVKDIWKDIAKHPLITSIAACVLAAVFAIGIDQASTLSLPDVPIFPPSWCRVEISGTDECSLFGWTVPCHKIFSEESLEHFGFGLEQSHNWTFFSTFLIGFIALWMTANDKTTNGFEGKSLKITCALYAMETAFFALARYYLGVSKPLVLIAAGHNLFEWSIVAHVAEMNNMGKTETEYGRLKGRLYRATVFICFVITICMCIPGLFASLAFEQLFGIVLDISLPIMFIGQLFDADRRRRVIYWLPALAHTIHLLGTILPLVFAIFLSGTVSWFSDFFLEVLINLSVPVAHLLYCIWSFRVGGYECFVKEEGAKDPDDKTKDPTAPFFAPSPDIVPSCPADKSGYISDGLRIKGVRTILIFGFILGLIPLLCIPYIFMPECGVTPCVDRSYVARTSILTVKDEYEGRISGLGISEIEDELQEEYPSLIGIEAGPVSHQVSHGKFYFVETWETLEGMNDGLLDSFVNKSGVKEVIEDYKHLNVHTDVSSAVCSSTHRGMISHKSRKSCAALWKVVGNPSFCSSIPGCKYMGRSPGSRTLVQLYMDDGSILTGLVSESKRSKQLTMMGNDQFSGYSSSLRLKRSGWFGCEMEYMFQNDLGGSRAFTDHFHNHFVPDVYMQLSN